MRHATRLASLLLAAGVLAACATRGPNMLAADAPRALPASGPVSVAWADPNTFSELRTSGNRQAAAEGDWLPKLAGYLQQRAATRLPAGHTLELTIVDIQRAGRYEPWLGWGMHDTRVVRDIYPPRMTVHFRQRDAAGNVVVEGERKLTDPGFLSGPAPFSDADPLRFEKRMVDSWLRRDNAFAAR